MASANRQQTVIHTVNIQRGSLVELIVNEVFAAASIAIAIGAIGAVLFIKNKRAEKAERKAERDALLAPGREAARKNRKLR